MHYVVKNCALDIVINKQHSVAFEYIDNIDSIDKQQFMISGRETIES